eukprot:5002-Heterococcus_DN1.PRE.1
MMNYQMICVPLSLSHQAHTVVVLTLCAAMLSDATTAQAGQWQDAFYAMLSYGCPAIANGGSILNAHRAAKAQEQLHEHMHANAHNGSVCAAQQLISVLFVYMYHYYAGAGSVLVHQSRCLS